MDLGIPEEAVARILKLLEAEGLLTALDRAVDAGGGDGATACGQAIARTDLTQLKQLVDRLRDDRRHPGAAGADGDAAKDADGHTDDGQDGGQDGGGSGGGAAAAIVGNLASVVADLTRRAQGSS